MWADFYFETGFLSKLFYLWWHLLARVPTQSVESRCVLLFASVLVLESCASCIEITANLRIDDEYEYRFAEYAYDFEAARYMPESPGPGLPPCTSAKKKRARTGYWQTFIV
ncbi:MAG: hypothetical protein C4519_04330 [Desulfobacteraceae bacterium]|nr:MAG: hypothetical protein C4519_04330 [Desulfobacteraceae bacterium]